MVKNAGRTSERKGWKGKRKGEEINENGQGVKTAFKIRQDQCNQLLSSLPLRSAGEQPLTACPVASLTAHIFADGQVRIQSELEAASSRDKRLLKEAVLAQLVVIRSSPNKQGGSSRAPKNRRMAEDDSSDEGDTSPLTSSRKRPSPRSGLSVSQRNGVQVGDIEALREFYRSMVARIQQKPAKLLAKEWIKLIHPRKTSTHPYTGEMETAPLWWPRQCFDGSPMRHKEPDHLYKLERLTLLPQILELIIDKRCRPEKTELMQSISVQDLKKCTNNLRTLFEPGKEEKRAYLNSMLRVAAQHERFAMGAIDATTIISLNYDPSEAFSDDEDESMNTPVSNHESPSSSGAGAMPSAQEIAHPPSPHSYLQPTSYGSAQHPGDTPLFAHPVSQQEFVASYQMHRESSAYPGSLSMGDHRRASWQATTCYPSPNTPTQLNGYWQHAMAPPTPQQVYGSIVPEEHEEMSHTPLPPVTSHALPPPPPVPRYQSFDGGDMRQMPPLGNLSIHAPQPDPLRAPHNSHAYNPGHPTQYADMTNEFTLPRPPPQHDRFRYEMQYDEHGRPRMGYDEHGRPRQ